MKIEGATYSVGGDGARPECDEPVPVVAEDMAGQQGLVYALVGVFLEVFEELRWYVSHCPRRSQPTNWRENSCVRGSNSASVPERLSWHPLGLTPSLTPQSIEFYTAVSPPIRQLKHALDAVHPRCSRIFICCAGNIHSSPSQAK